MSASGLASGLVRQLTSAWPLRERLELCGLKVAMRSALPLMLGIALLAGAPRTASAVQLRLFDVGTLRAPSPPPGLLPGSGGEVPEVSPARRTGEFFASFGAGLGVSAAGGLLVFFSDLLTCALLPVNGDRNMCFTAPAVFEALGLMLPTFLSAHISTRMALTDGYRSSYGRVLGWSFVARLPFAFATIAFSTAAARNAGWAEADYALGALAMWLATFVVGTCVELYVAHSGQYEGGAPAAPNPPAQTQLESAANDRPWAMNASRAVVLGRPVIQVPVFTMDF